MVKVSEIETVNTGRKKQDVIVADTGGAVKVTLWDWKAGQQYQVYTGEFRCSRMGQQEVPVHCKRFNDFENHWHWRRKSSGWWMAKCIPSLHMGKSCQSLQEL